MYYVIVTKTGCQIYTNSLLNPKVIGTVLNSQGKMITNSSSIKIERENIDFVINFETQEEFDKMFNDNINRHG